MVYSCPAPVLDERAIHIQIIWMSKSLPAKLFGSFSFSSRELPPALESMLSTLEDQERERRAKIEADIALHYQTWSDLFNEMKAHFEEVWELFGGIEDRISLWKRKVPADGREGKWGPLTLSKRGYAFSAGMAKGDDPRATKWLLVGFGEGDRTQEGIGDERAFGFRGKPGPELVGLDRCDGMLPEKALESAKSLSERVLAYDFVFHLNHVSLGQRTFHVPRNKLTGCGLAQLCLGLFMALNTDDLRKLQLLTQSQNPLLLAE